MDTLPVELRVKITLMLQSVFDVRNMTIAYPELLDLKYVSDHMFAMWHKELIKDGTCRCAECKVRIKREKKEAQERLTRAMERYLHRWLSSFIENPPRIRNVNVS